MANHGAAALLIASLLVAVVVLADARVTVQVQRDIVGGTYLHAVYADQLNLTVIGTYVAAIELQVMR
jgi:hypothetical protein